MMKVTGLAAGVALLAAAGHHYTGKALKPASTAATAPDAPKGITPLDPSKVPPTEIGMNVSPFGWYLKEAVLTDPSKDRSEIQVGGPGSPPLRTQLQRDENGWPINVPAGTMISVVLTPTNSLVRKFTCTFSPGWSVWTLSAAEQTQNGNSVTIRPVSKDGDNFVMEFTAKQQGASLKDLSCSLLDPPLTGLFRPEFIKDIKPFKVVRFMNWMLANNAPASKWAERPTSRTASFAERGVPLEHMVELANTGGFDPWFTLPLDAEDAYVRNFATYVRDHLGSGQRAYVEVSNEVWNSAFGQSKEALKLGKLRYPSADDIHATDYYYADQVRHQMAIWNDVFKGREKRIVRIIGNQAGWAERANNLLGHKDTWRSVDALAIAPYFGDVPNDVPGKGKERVDNILARVPGYIDTAIGWARNNKVVAAKYGLPLYAYEAGPGLLAYEPSMVKDVTDAVNDPRFTTLYAKYLDRWRTEIGGTIVLYNYGEGIWGHLDHTGQPWDSSTKMTAAYRAIAALPGQRDRLPADALAKLRH